jgi:hypothetical protein
MIVAEMDRDELCGATGARSIAAFVAWKTGASARNAKTIATVAHRLAAFPRRAQGMRSGHLRQMNEHRPTSTSSVMTSFTRFPKSQQSLSSNRAP